MAIPSALVKNNNNKNSANNPLQNTLASNANSASQITLVPPTPTDTKAQLLGYQSSTVDLIQSTNATLSPK